MDGVVALLLFVNLVSCNVVFNVLDYGAKGDGKTLDTAAIQAAFDAAKKNGYGTIYLPTPHNFLSMPITWSASNAVLLIDKGAILTASDDIDHWPHDGSKYKNFIGGTGLKNITITGGGTLEGQGAVWWDRAKKNTLKYDRNNFVELTSTGLVIHDITGSNAPFHHFEIHGDQCQMYDVTVQAPGTSDQTDAANIRCSNTHVHDCYFTTGDDNVAIHSSHVVVENCFFGTGHGASIGSLDTGAEVENVTVRNIQFDGTSCGPRIKTVSGAKSGYVRHVLYKNLTMKNIQDEAIKLNMYYQTEKDETTGLKISDVSFEDITVDGCKVAGYFRCQPSQPCKDIHVTNYKATGIKDILKPYSYCQNVQGSTSNVSPKISCF